MLSQTLTKPSPDAEYVELTFIAGFHRSDHLWSCHSDFPSFEICAIVEINSNKKNSFDKRYSITWEVKSLIWDVHKLEQDHPWKYSYSERYFIIFS